MKTLVVLIVGILIGAGAFWVYTTKDGQSASKSAGDQIGGAANSTRDAVQEKIRSLDLKPDQVKEDLDRTGRVIRRKVREAGDAIADATADARITGAIKGKLVANKDLSALSISVNTTGGIVTLSGSVNSMDDISKAIMVAMDMDGVREVISTLQVKK
jgi:osmotically-inducible protein OsmY